jgi:prepilin-type N-terminal cleavage/methylation domain-containing protein
MRNSFSRAGFTLIELVVVMSILALLVAIAAPRYFGNLERSRETALRQTLAVTRTAIDQFYADNGSYPEDLGALVARRYLRSLPFDPLTESSATWIVTPPEDPAKGGIYDLHSSAEGSGRNGTPFREW